MSIIYKCRKGIMGVCASLLILMTSIDAVRLQSGAQVETEGIFGALKAAKDTY